MQKLTNQERLKPWMGVILFIVGLLFLIFIGSFLQSNFGMMGVVLTELGFLGISVAYCLIRKVKISEVFHVRKIKVSEFFGVVFMLIGSFLLSLICVSISLFFAPNVEEEMNGLSGLIYGNGLSYFLIMTIVAILPAICEESFMRGAILSSFRSLKRDWVIILIVGVMFGILHLSPLRFLNTACFGAVLAYVMVKTNNFLLPVLLHFLNNFISTLFGYLSTLTVKSEEAGELIAAASSALSNTSPLMILGSYLVTGCLFPMFLVLGAMLLDRKSHRPRRFLIAGIISTVLLISGIIITGVTVTNSIISNSKLTWNYEYTVSEEDLEDGLGKAGIEVSEEKAYTFVVSASGSGAPFSFKVVNDEGEALINKSSKSIMFLTDTINLTPGHYDLIFEGDDEIVGKKFTYDVMVF